MPVRCAVVMTFNVLLNSSVWPAHTECMQASIEDSAVSKADYALPAIVHCKLTIWAVRQSQQQGKDLFPLVRQGLSSVIESHKSGVVAEMSKESGDRSGCCWSCRRKGTFRFAE